MLMMSEVTGLKNAIVTRDDEIVEMMARNKRERQ